jgi:hypothetical protein
MYELDLTLIKFVFPFCKTAILNPEHCAVGQVCPSTSQLMHTQLSLHIKQVMLDDAFRLRSVFSHNKQVIKIGTN